MQRTRKEKSMQRAELIARQKEIFERHQEKVKQDSIKEQLLSRTPDLLLGNGSLKDNKGRRVTTLAIVRKQEAATRRLSNFGHGQKSGGGRLSSAVRKWGAISAFSNKKKSPNPFFRQPAEHPGHGSNATADGNVVCPEEEEEEEDRNDIEDEDYNDDDDVGQGRRGRRRPPQRDSTNRKTSAKQTQKARKSPRQSRAGTISGRGKNSPGTARRPHTAYSSHSISASPHFRGNKGDAAAAVILSNEQEPGFADELNSLYISARYRLRSAQKERRSVFQMRPSTTPLMTSPRAPRHELRGTQRGQGGGTSNGGGARTSSPMRSKAHAESDSSPPRTSGRPHTVGGKGRRTKPTAHHNTRQPPHQQQTHHPHHPHHPHPPRPPRPPPVPRRPMTSPREPSAGKFHAPVAFGGFGGRGGVGGATPLQRRMETSTTQNESKKKKTLKKKMKKKKRKSKKTTQKTTPNNQSATPKGAPLTPWDDDGGSRRNSDDDDDDGDYAQQPRQCYSSTRSDESDDSGGGVHGEEEGGASEQPQSNTWVEAAAGNAPRSSFSQLLEELVHQEKGGEARPGRLITLIDDLLEKDHA